MTYKESTIISASPAAIYAIYTDVSQWPEWDKEVERASMDNGFQLGGEGKIKPKGAPESKMKLVEVTPDKSFTIECSLPLCKMRFVHLLTAEGAEATKVVNELQFTGLLAPVFGRLIGKGIHKTMPATLRGLKEYAEAKAQS
jgi:hypothetical protein